jgi:hypothetical protein
MRFISVLIGSSATSYMVFLGTGNEFLAAAAGIALGSINIHLNAIQAVIEKR